MHQDVSYRKIPLQRLILRERYIVTLIILLFFRILIELRSQDIGDMGVDIESSLGHEILDRIVGAEHLGDRCQIVERIFRNSRCLDRFSLLIVGLRVPPAVLIDQFPVPHDRDLRTRESMLHIGADDLLNKLDRLGLDPHILRFSGNDHRIRDTNTHRPFGKPADLQ